MRVRASAGRHPEQSPRPLPGGTGGGPPHTAAMTTTTTTMRAGVTVTAGAVHGDCSLAAEHAAEQSARQRRLQGMPFAHLANYSAVLHEYDLLVASMDLSMCGGAAQQPPQLAGEYQPPLPQHAGPPLPARPQGGLPPPSGPPGAAPPPSAFQGRPQPTVPNPGRGSGKLSTKRARQENQ